MQHSIVYQFPRAQLANRFLNDVNSPQHHHIKAKLFRGGDKVQVNYQFDDVGFDTTSSEMDDLAARYDGTEVNG